MAKVVEEELKVKDRDDQKIIQWKAEVSNIIAQQKEETVINNELWHAYQEAGGTGIKPYSTAKQSLHDKTPLSKAGYELFG